MGFNYSHYTCQPAASNMRSANENTGVVQAYLVKELALGRIVGPVTPDRTPRGTQLSPFGVIPKSSQPGKWRLIVDLSSAEGKSINGEIEPKLCFLQYLRLDDVVEQIASVGQGQ